MATKILGDPALNLQVVKQRTTVVVEPISQSGSEYDSAEITTVVTMDNNQSEEVEFILPYPTVQFSASLAVTSAGDEFYKERITRVGRITGDLKRIKPYIQRLGLSPDSYDTGKELKAIAKQFRAGTLKLPAGLITVKIQLSAVINASTNADGIKMYSFKAYSPLPAFSLSNQRTPLTLAVLFKGDESIHPQIVKREVANPFGDNTNPITEILDQSLGEDISFYWKWQTDPVVTFEYHY
jgi:hypothetical protein